MQTQWCGYLTGYTGSELLGLVLDLQWRKFSGMLLFGIKVTFLTGPFSLVIVLGNCNEREINKLGNVY